MLVLGGTGEEGACWQPGAFPAARERDPGQAAAGRRSPPAHRGRAEGETTQSREFQPSNHFLSVFCCLLY